MQVAHQVGAAAAMTEAAAAAALTSSKHAVAVTAMSMHLYSPWRGILAGYAAVHSRPTVRGCALHRMTRVSGCGGRHVCGNTGGALQCGVASSVHT